MPDERFIVSFETPGLVKANQEMKEFAASGAQASRTIKRDADSIGASVDGSVSGSMTRAGKNSRAATLAIRRNMTEVNQAIRGAFAGGVIRDFFAGSTIQLRDFGRQIKVTGGAIQEGVAQSLAYRQAALSVGAALASAHPHLQRQTQASNAYFQALNKVGIASQKVFAAQQKQAILSVAQALTNVGVAARRATEEIARFAGARLRTPVTAGAGLATGFDLSQVNTTQLKTDIQELSRLAANKSLVNLPTNLAQTGIQAELAGVRMGKLRSQLSGAAAEGRRTVNVLGLLRAALVVFATIAIVKQFADFLDVATRIEGQLRLVTHTTEELIAVQNSLFLISQRTRTSFEENVTLFTRVARATGTMRLTYQQLLDVTEAYALATRISFASQQEQIGSTRQFTQAMGAGAAQGEELRSITENNARVAEVFAKKFGVAVGQLIALNKANPGILKSEKLVRALLEALPQLREEGAKLPLTIGDGFARLRNSLVLFSRGIENSTGVAAGLAQALSWVADNVDRVVLSILTLLGIFILNTIIQSVVGLGGAFVSMGAHARTSLAIVASRVVKAAVLVTTLGTGILNVSKALLTLKAGNALVALLTINFAKLAIVLKGSVVPALLTLGRAFLPFTIGAAAIYGAYLALRKFNVSLRETLAFLTFGLSEKLIEFFDSFSAFTTRGINPDNFKDLLAGFPNVDSVGKDLEELDKKARRAMARLLSDVRSLIAELDPLAAALNYIIEVEILLAQALNKNIISETRAQELRQQAIRSVAGVTDVVEEYRKETLILRFALNEGAISQAEFNEAIKDLQSEKFGGFESLVTSLSKVEAVTRELDEARKTLNEAERAGLINPKESRALYILLQRELIGVGNATVEYGQHVEVLDDALKAQVITTQEYTLALRNLRIAYLETQRTGAAGLERGFLKLEDEATDTASQVERVFLNAFDSLADHLEEFLEKGKIDFKGFIESIINDLRKLAAQRIAFTIFAALGFGGQGAGGGLGGLLGGGIDGSSLRHNLVTGIQSIFKGNFAGAFGKGGAFRSAFQNLGSLAAGLLGQAFAEGVKGIFGFGGSSEANIGGQVGSIVGGIAGSAIAGPIGASIGSFLGDIFGSLIGGLFAHVPTEGTEIRQAIKKHLIELDVAFAHEIKNSVYGFQWIKDYAEKTNTTFLEASKEFIPENFSGLVTTQLDKQLEAVGLFLTEELSAKLGKDLEQTSVTFANMIAANLEGDSQKIALFLEDITKKAGITRDALKLKLEEAFLSGRISIEFYTRALEALDLLFKSVDDRINELVGAIKELDQQLIDIANRRVEIRVTYVQQLSEIGAVDPRVANDFEFESKRTQFNALADVRAASIETFSVDDTLRMIDLIKDGRDLVVQRYQLEEQAIQNTLQRDIDALTKGAAARQEALQEQYAAQQEAITLQQEGISAQIDGLREQKDQIDELYDTQLDALKEQLKLAQAFERAAERVKGVLESVALSDRGALTRSEQQAFLGREAADLRAQLQGATGERRAELIEELSKVLQQQVETTPFDKGDFRQIQVFDEVVAELEKLRAEALASSVGVESLEQQILDTELAQKVALEGIEAQITAMQAQDRALSKLSQDLAKQEAAELKAIEKQLAADIIAVELRAEQELVNFRNITQQKLTFLAVLEEQLAAEAQRKLEDQRTLLVGQLVELVGIDQANALMAHQQTAMLIIMGSIWASIERTNAILSSIIPAASGYSGMVTQPQLFLAGERGPEWVDITPTGERRSRGRGDNGSGGDVYHEKTDVHVNVYNTGTAMDGKQMARVIAKNIDERGEVYRSVEKVKGKAARR